MSETRTVRRRADGEQTHEAILDAAMRIASIEGLKSLTIGRLAREVGISKSGLYAHFGSKEQLQMETFQAAGSVYVEEVLVPGLRGDTPVERIENLCEAFFSYLERGVFPGGCFFAGLLAEVDADSGPLHEQMATAQRGYLELLENLTDEAQAAGELRGEVDPAQLAFEIEGTLQFTNYMYVLTRDTKALDRGRTAVRRLLDQAGRER